ncbi:bifunctional phosphoribosylaminoimidazolecarboxamide formyltransferase/IMP cyclohydrolase [Thalassobaculum sp. OXR-137]|uniref:bifunctional phosphoribosylaminoimidazolecarboxamide formyltransferase/IMP cyclohydrolase n=1 Tax=Thalassobaculum sp. OXR-137 TaxID=3100173 RepID=UPI002AC9CE68|nr:bifunctional phosphoribosylaminoimidazolecarboxamide formyltransferase/IMP cyclohydrolase [Thalassobaculum sp. OXR-137]WPZ35346.1 bifunctional phosphoribosylaminoimidazolecarboxamide formyltransferase/IMP cyclohydrolase [Thalassobaculum sp. OXR-137]
MAAPDLVPVARALISVSDKTGLIEFAAALSQMGVEILSTGGTAKAIAEAGIPVVEVAERTGFPEVMDGRVKTLHPVIHGGLLARRDLDHHVAAMDDHGIAPIDLLVVNLYPFEATRARGAGYDESVENIDIGGPAMIRAASKNHDFVTVIVDVEDYGPVLEEMRANEGATTLALRRKLAATAYGRTAAYDAAIAGWLAGEVGEVFPRRFTLAGSAPQVLRYGENPHQQAAFYRTTESRAGVSTAEQMQGKELSYNNLNDTDAAFELAAELDEPGIAIIKHANPCGVAIAGSLADAWDAALACDPVSAFGGIVAANRKMDAATAEKIASIFSEVVIAPDFDPAALEVFAAKKNLRVLKTGGMPDPTAKGLMVKNLAGGLLIQSRDAGRVTQVKLKVVTKRAPTEAEMRDLLLAFRIGKHVKSNTIVYVKDGSTAGIGAGQMSRVDAARIAAVKAQDAAKAAGWAEPRTVGSVAASDAFFPFADGLITVAEAGATAIIQPGGSIRDEEIIAAADERNLAMVLTGMRHFRH